MWVALVPSGMDWLDTEIGGLPAAGVVAAVGGAGSGKTSFALGFAVAQLRRQQSVCYLTSETPEVLLETSRAMMEHDLRPYIARGSLTVLSFAPFFVNKVRSLSSNDPPLAELKELFDERRIAHVIIDTLDPMLSWIDTADAKASVRSMLGQIQGWGRSVMCTMNGAAPAAAELARTASGSFELGSEKLVIRHAGWCNVYDIEAPLAFVQGRGLIVRANAGRKPAGKGSPMSDMSLISAAPLLPESERGGGGGKPDLHHVHTTTGDHKPWMSLIGDANKLLGPQAAAVLIASKPPPVAVSSPSQSHVPPPVIEHGGEGGGGAPSESPRTPRLPQSPPLPTIINAVEPAPPPPPVNATAPHGSPFISLRGAGVEAGPPSSSKTIVSPSPQHDHEHEHEHQEAAATAEDVAPVSLLEDPTRVRPPTTGQPIPLPSATRTRRQ